MGRRQAWLVLLVCFVVAIGGAIWLSRGRATYGFLAHKEPVPLTAKDTAFEQGAVSITVYTFQMDWDRLIKEADPELRSHGLRFLKGNDREHDYFDVSISAAFEREPARPATAVVIVRDHRYGEGRGLRGFARAHPEDEGWVTVTVVHTGQDSLWDRVGRWFGL
jgi:hypothetical protein